MVQGDLSLFRTLSQNPDISYIGPDRKFQLLDSKDPVQPTPQWGSKETYGIRQIKATSVWNYFGLKGSGVRVGILDTGWSNHEELRGKVIHSRDFVSEYQLNEPNDDHGHGSHCMGIIAGGNASGKAIGVAPGAKFLVAKIFSDLGYTHESIILRAMQWIADPDNDPTTDDFPRVINNSWGHPRGSDKEEKPLWDALSTWRKLGIIPIFAAGNEGPEKETISSPASFPHVLAVGSANRWRFVHKSSSRGPARWGGQRIIKPDMLAPGVAIFSVDHKGGYVKKTGTSMAAPHVTGIVALMLQARPKITADRVIDLLQKSSSIGYEEFGNHKYGYGNVNARMALALLNRENQLLLKINSGTRIASVKVSPLEVTYAANTLGELLISLPSGKFEFEVSAFGYETEDFKIKVERHENIEKEITLEPAELYDVELQVFSPERVSVDAEVEILHTPIEPMQTEGGSLKVELPKGEFEVLVQSRGYLPLKETIKVKKSAEFPLQLSHLPDVLVIDDDYANASEEIYADALNSNQLTHQTKKVEEGIEKLFMMSFEKIIWYTGSSGLGTLNPRDREFIQDYVESGGRLLLTGQDIGFEIGKSKFYQEFLGAEFLKDHSGSTHVQASDLSLDLTPGDNIPYVRSFDVMKVLSEKTRALCFYEDGSVAGIHIKRGMGELIYLGFGFEAIAGSQARSRFLSSLTDLLAPDTQSRLERIRWAYRNDPGLHAILMKRFLTLPERERTDAGKWISHQDQKAPFKAILADELYQRDE